MTSQARQTDALRPDVMSFSLPVALQVRRPSVYFVYILLSTALRSFEAGMVASMMIAIKESLSLTYTLEGVVAASPDFGIVPSGIIAVFLFHFFAAYNVLVVGQFCIGFSALFAVLIPTAASLIFARALGGLFWGLAAVHYPSWINKHGGENATMWLGLYNAMLLVGILIGYVVGAVADTTHFVSWRHLYGFEGFMMVACGVVCIFMDPQLVQVSKRVVPLALSGTRVFSGGEGPSTSGCHDSGEKESLLGSPNNGHKPAANDGACDDLSERADRRTLGAPGEASDADSPKPRGEESGNGDADTTPGVFATISQVLHSPLYVWTVFTGAIISGGICFILYFVTQALEELHFFSTRNTFILVGTIFVVSPIPGNVAGAWYLHRKGGYRNFTMALRFTVATAAMSLIGCMMLAISALLGVRSRSHSFARTHPS